MIDIKQQQYTVASFSAALPNTIIERWILPITRTIADGWVSYADIEEIRGGIYCQNVVVYQDNFVALGDGSVHTQYIENTWFRAKRKRLKQCGTSADLFLSYLAEFMWRNRHNKKTLCRRPHQHHRHDHVV